MKLFLFRSNFAVNFLPVSNLAGATPVVVWDVIRYWNKKRETFVSILPSFIFFMPSLSVCTARSAKPFEAVWFEAVFMFLMPLILRNCSNSSMVKFYSSSLTSFSGSPWVANTILNFSVVAREVEVLMGKTLIHLEYAWKAFSLDMGHRPCTLDHGRFGHSHQCKGT